MKGVFFAVLAGAVACGGESKRVEPVDSSAGGTGGSQSSSGGGDGGALVGTTGSSGSGGSTVAASAGDDGCSDLAPGSADCCANSGPTDNVELTPGTDGWIDHQDVCNVLGIQGTWHAYGDQYDSPETHARCITIGLHMPSECAQVTAPPPPPAWGFPNVNGELHTTGTTDSPLACPAGLMSEGCPVEDFENMNGSGIALDFNADAGPPDGDGTRHAWDPAAHGVIGVSFVIDTPPKWLRVEFPMLLTAAEAAADDPPITALNPTTDDHTAGAPYWGAQANGDAKFPASPVKSGQNIITWDQVASPRRYAYAFDAQRMIGIRFHVPAGPALGYDFTVKNFTFLRHL